MRSIERVAEVLDAPIHRPSRSADPLTGFAIDSRDVQPGQCFVALPGERTDGHRFLSDAYRNGAGGALVRDVPSELTPDCVNCIEVPDPLRALQQLAAQRRAELTVPIVGITGSAGKTTTKELVHRVLSKRYRAYRSPGNHNTEIGLPLALLNMPDDVEVGVFEMGLQHPGDIRALAEIAQPTIGVMTAIGDAHIGFFPDQEALAREKWALMEGLPDHAHAVLNLDAPFVHDWRGALACEVTTISVERTDADVRAAAIDDGDLDGLQLQVARGNERFELSSRLLGRQNAYTVLLAIAVAQALDVPWTAIQEALSSFEPISQRMELKSSSRFGLILDDTYNASPTAMTAALRMLASLRTDRHKVAVLGDMRELGSLSEPRHQEVADRIAELGIEHIFSLGERASAITEALRARYDWPAERAVHAENLSQLLERLWETLPDDRNLVLIKGSRAMALDQLIEQIETPTATSPTEAERR